MYFLLLIVLVVCMRVEFLDDPLLEKAIAAESLCYKKFKEHKSILILGDCLFQWYERYVEEFFFWFPKVSPSFYPETNPSRYC